MFIVSAVSDSFYLALVYCNNLGLRILFTLYEYTMLI